MTGSSDFSTWVALAGAAIAAGLCAITSSSLWVLIPGALSGACLGYWAERVGRYYVDRAFARNRPP
jgi:membrane protease YdiL (CAAX protease family)